MKTHGLLRGSGSGLAAVMRLESSVNFLSDRHRPIDMTPAFAATSSAYVWRRVFLNGRGHRA